MCYELNMPEKEMASEYTRRRNYKKNNILEQRLVFNKN